MRYLCVFKAFRPELPSVGNIVTIPIGEFAGSQIPPATGAIARTS
jgi:hypothetical protein